MILSIVFDFSQVDGFATTIALVGYLVVFLALVLLYFVFYNLPSLLKIDFRSLFSREVNQEKPLRVAEPGITGELSAAIGMAMYMYLNEMHDQESGVITIKKVSKRYSPWSSKIYGLRQIPRQ
jgi:glutaconyl-CoA/methylmalonyl-CoA decarboxylase subunit delta